MSVSAGAAIVPRRALRVARGAGRWGAWRRLRARRAALLAAAGLLCVASVALEVSIGATELGPRRLAGIVAAIVGIDGAEPASALEEALLVHVRAPRAALALLAGATLASCGAALQALLRNPLVEPGLVGTSAGASFGAVAWIVAGASLGTDVAATLGLAGSAFAGAALATAFVLALSASRRRLDGAVLLLAGVALTAILGAGTGLLLFTADDAALRDATFWSMGSLSRAAWPALAVAGPCMAIACAAIASRAGALDALLLGEAEARALGVDVERTKRVLVVATALGVGSAVALTGAIGFVGLVVPHVARLLVGAAHRTALPLAALLGASALALADALARTVAAPAELPIGVVTAAVGGPFFLALLLARRGADVA